VPTLAARARQATAYSRRPAQAGRRPRLRRPWPSRPTRRAGRRGRRRRSPATPAVSRSGRTPRCARADASCCKSCAARLLDCHMPAVSYQAWFSCLGVALTRALAARGTALTRRAAAVQPPPLANGGGTAQRAAPHPARQPGAGGGGRGAHDDSARQPYNGAAPGSAGGGKAAAEARAAAVQRAMRRPPALWPGEPWSMGRAASLRSAVPVACRAGRRAGPFAAEVLSAAGYGTGVRAAR